MPTPCQRPPLPPAARSAARAAAARARALTACAAPSVPALRRHLLPAIAVHSLAEEAAARGGQVFSAAPPLPDAGGSPREGASNTNGAVAAAPVPLAAAANGNSAAAANGRAVFDAAAAAASSSSSSSSAASDDSSIGFGSSSNGAGATSSSNGTAAAASPASSSGAAAPGPAAPASVVMTSGASMLPHPEKAHRGGEDAFFISDPPLALGIADGVGGWAEIGVDAGEYARLLMTHAKEEAEALLASAGPLSPQAVLERAYYRTNVQGSSTACLLALNGSTLHASNLGDSGFAIVRSGAPAFQSPQQQHNFNFPYQLGSADGGASDHPGSAMRFELTVKPGDIIITGSDGLWDNVFAEEAATIVSRCRAQGETAEGAAHTLCRYARMRASDNKHHSPFSYAACAAGYIFLGGKMDDICVVVSFVS